MRLLSWHKLGPVFQGSLARKGIANRFMGAEANDAPTKSPKKTKEGYLIGIAIFISLFALNACVTPSF